MMDIPFVYSSNGDAFLEHDATGNSTLMEQEFPMTNSLRPADLWTRYRHWKGIDDRKEQIITQDYYIDDVRKAPRYYQLNAINRTSRSNSERAEPDSARNGNRDR